MLMALILRLLQVVAEGKLIYKAAEAPVEETQKFAFLNSLDELLEIFSHEPLDLEFANEDQRKQLVVAAGSTLKVIVGI